MAAIAGSRDAGTAGYKRPQGLLAWKTNDAGPLDTQEDGSRDEALLV